MQYLPLTIGLVIQILVFTLVKQYWSHLPSPQCLILDMYLGPETENVGLLGAFTRVALSAGHGFW